MQKIFLVIKLTVISVSSILLANLLPAQSADNATFSADLVQKHNQLDDCWIIVGQDVYDVTSFSEDASNAYFDGKCGGDAIGNTEDGEHLLDFDISSYKIGIIQ